MTAPVRARTPSRPPARPPARAPRGAAASSRAAAERQVFAPEAKATDADEAPAAGAAHTTARVAAVSARFHGAAVPSTGAAVAGVAAPQGRRVTEAPARPTLRLVDDRRLHVTSRRHRARLLLVLTGILVIGSLFAVVICHAMLVTGQGRLDGLEQQVTEEQTRYQALRLEVAELEAPGRIVAEAQGRLGMVSPENITYLAPVPAAGAPPVAGGEPPADRAGAPWGAVKPLLGGRR